MLDDRLATVIIEELRQTRIEFSAASDYFSQAVGQIKWNRRNTIIQYVLSTVLAVVMIAGGLFYWQEHHEQCLERNEIRSTIVESLDDHARAIGLALVAVTNAPPEKVEEYMASYRNQFHPPILELQDC